MSYLSRVSRGATATVVQGQDDQCSKYSSSSFLGLRPSSKSSSRTSSIELGDATISRAGGQGEEEDRKKQVDESFHKVMFLNCWSQS